MKIQNVRNKFKPKLAIRTSENPTKDISIAFIANLLYHFFGKEATFIEEKQLARILNVNHRAMRPWLAEVGVRNYGKYYNQRDLADVILEAIQGMESDPTIDGNWLVWANSFCLGDFDMFGDEPREVYIIRRPQIDGSVKWSINVENPGWVMGKNFQWIYEPPPSQRNKEFMETYRYDTKEEAIKYFVAARETTMEPIILTYNTDYK